MFERLSDHARQVLAKARAEALRLRHGALAPEHLLLGILLTPTCHAARLLHRFGVATDALLETLQANLPAGQQTVAEPLPFEPATKRALAHTLEAMAGLGAAHVGTEHLLLGLAADPEGVAARFLAQAGIGTEALRAAAAETQPPLPKHRRRLLLISNSTMHGQGYLQHCAAEIRDFLGSRKTVLFVPYALANHDEYAAKARAAFQALGHELVSVHAKDHSPAAVEGADAVFIGGGNTFRLLNALYHHRLLPVIQRRVAAGMPYLGSSAGTNVATPSIRTTNDMPIVQPPSFTALDLVPFQINPHYLDPDPSSKHMGETREERLRQFHEEHPTAVLGLREGCMLRVEGPRMELRGTTRARLFRRGRPAEEFTPVCDLSFLLHEEN